MFLRLMIFPKAAMRGFKKTLLIAGALLCFLAAGWIFIGAGLPQRATYTGQISEDGFSIAPELNSIAPNFEQPALNGAPISLASLRGSPVIVNFWATWCEPCRIEMPDLQTVYTEYQADGLRILAVNLGEPSPLINEWVQSFGLTFDILLDERQSVAALYYLRGQPSTYIISPQGIITDIFYGPVSASTLRAALAPYLR